MKKLKRIPWKFMFTSAICLSMSMLISTWIFLDFRYNFPLGIYELRYWSFFSWFDLWVHLQIKFPWQFKIAIMIAINIINYFCVFRLWAIPFPSLSLRNSQIPCTSIVRHSQTFISLKSFPPTKKQLNRCQKPLRILPMDHVSSSVTQPSSKAFFLKSFREREFNYSVNFQFIVS